MALRNLMARYVDAANRRDGERWKSTWAEDATWRLMGTAISGREQIHAAWSGFLAGFEFALLLPASGHVEVAGDQASGGWYLQEFTRTLQGERGLIIGHYRDRYTRCGDDWVYQERDYTALYSGPPDLSGHFSALPPPV
jgi:SnoaL-like domain